MLSHVSSSSIMTTKSCLPARKVGHTPPKTTFRKTLGLMNIKRLVGSNRCSFILKLLHGVITNIELLLSYVVLRVGQMSYTAWLYVSITEYGFICPPYFAARFSCSCRLCSSRSFSVRIKGICPPQHPLPLSDRCKCLRCQELDYRACISG